MDCAYNKVMDPQVFKVARVMAPSVIYIDEAEKVRTHIDILKTEHGMQCCSQSISNVLFSSARYS